PESSLNALDSLVSVTNTAAPAEERVRSYLDANCSHCHRPGGARAFWDARYGTPLEEQGIIYGALANKLGITGARVVVPEDQPRSILYQRANSLTPEFKMPPLAK